MTPVKRRWIDALHDKELAHHHARGLGDTAIAEAMGFPLGVIVEQREAIGLPRNLVAVHHLEPATPIPRDRPSPIFTAQTLLGDRLTERALSGYWLDGRPVGLNDIMRAANRLLKSSGVEQVGTNPAWLV